jgi:hypothetical protein
VSSEILVQFVGFEAKALVREYTFTVREFAGELREFTLTIENRAFNAHHVRYQDAPDICSLKLRRELVTYAGHPPKTHYRITDAELEDYRSAHAPRTARSLYGRRPAQDF